MVETVFVTCEHGGNRIPPRYVQAFAGAEAKRALRSHRGRDPGALTVARALARRLGASLQYTTISRLLIELNRSIGHARLFSEFSSRLPAEERRRVLQVYYHSYRNRLEERLRAATSRGDRVVHISVHSFTPVLAGEVRNADFALLYDPARAHERALSEHWIREFRRAAPGLRVRRNYPYRGAADGLTTWLRRRFPPTRYLGIEIELNQRHLEPGATARRKLIDAVLSSAAIAVGRRSRS